MCLITLVVSAVSLCILRGDINIPAAVCASVHSLRPHLCSQLLFSSLIKSKTRPFADYTLIPGRILLLNSYVIFLYLLKEQGFASNHEKNNTPESLQLSFTPNYMVHISLTLCNNSLKVGYAVVSNGKV